MAEEQWDDSDVQPVSLNYRLLVLALSRILHSASPVFHRGERASSHSQLEGLGKPQNQLCHSYEVELVMSAESRERWWWRAWVRAKTRLWR